MKTLETNRLTLTLLNNKVVNELFYIIYRSEYLRMVNDLVY